MIAKTKRHIRPGYEYDHLFPAPGNDNKTIRRNANVYHTVSFIPKVVGKTLSQTAGIARLLKGKSVHQTCKNIWHFVYGHINYKKDQEGYEQIRSPARTWHDRRQGVDCDCYSVFISSILTNLGIEHLLRITKYQRDYFQHIYPVVVNDDKNITIDCVTDRFDYEVPYSEKKDYPMDLQYLNGFDDGGMEELGRIIKKNIAKPKGPSPVKPPTAPRLSKKAMKKANRSGPATPAPAGSSVTAPKKKGFFKKALNVVNRINPATVLLRNGILAAMKLNTKNVAARLRWSYLDPRQAEAKGIDPAKFQKLITTRQKLENIFFGAGGKPDNLRKAILGGKGNKDKAVSGLGMLPMNNTDHSSPYTPLQHLLGTDLYYSENVEGMEGFQGFGQLGEPVTLTSVGAAMGVIAGIVAALKQIGDIFKSKQAESADFEDAKTDATENSIPLVNTAATTPAPAINPAVPVETNSPVTDQAILTNDLNPVSNNTLVRTSDNIVPVTTNKETVTSDLISEDGSSATTTSTGASSSGDEKQSFWEKNKKWLKPVAIGAGGLTIIAIAYRLSKSSGQKNKASPTHSLAGLPHKRRKAKNHHRKKHGHKKSIALL